VKSIRARCAGIPGPAQRAGRSETARINGSQAPSPHPSPACGTLSHKWERGSKALPIWALAIFRRDDYARALVPMLPVTRGVAYTRWQIFEHCQCVGVLAGF